MRRARGTTPREPIPIPPPVKLGDRPADVPRAMSASSDVQLDEAITGRKAEGPAAGNQIGPYRLVRAVGVARDRVFEVEHLTTGARGTMRLLAAGSLAAAGGSERISAEAQALRAIGSRHIVALIDVIDGDGAAGVDAVVTELAQGRTLAQLMADQGPLPVEQFVPILVQILAALKAAHGALLVHRNLCPEKVLLVSDGDADELVKLLDFGVAGGLGASPNRADADDPCRSPEQVAGASIDHRADIYAFGVIVYELLCGRLPFEPLTRGAPGGEPRGPAPAPSVVLETPAGRTLDGIARRCLREQPEERFASVEELEERLAGVMAEDIAEEGSYRVPHDWNYQPAASPLRRWGLVGAVGLLVLGGGGLLVARMGRPPPRRCWPRARLHHPSRRRHPSSHPRRWPRSPRLLPRSPRPRRSPRSPRLLPQSPRLPPQSPRPRRWPRSRRLLPRSPRPHRSSRSRRLLPRSPRPRPPRPRPPPRWRRRPSPTPHRLPPRPRLRPRRRRRPPATVTCARCPPGKRAPRRPTPPPPASVPPPAGAAGSREGSRQTHQPRRHGRPLQLGEANAADSRKTYQRSPRGSRPRSCWQPSRRPAASPRPWTPRPGCGSPPSGAARSISSSTP